MSFIHIYAVYIIITSWITYTNHDTSSLIITILPSNSIPFGKSSSHRALTRWHFLSVGPASKPTEMHPLMQQYLGSVGSCWGWKNPKPSFLGVISYNPYFGVQNLHFPWVVGVQGLVLLLDIFLVPVEVERLKSYYLPGFYTSQVVWNRPDFSAKITSVEIASFPMKIHGRTWYLCQIYQNFPQTHL